jgi:hypothetical protein
MGNLLQTEQPSRTLSARRLGSERNLVHGRENRFIPFSVGAGNGSYFPKTA